MEQYKTLIEGSVIGASLIGGIRGVRKGRKVFHLEHLHITPTIRTKLGIYQFMKRKRAVMGGYFVRGAMPLAFKIGTLTTAIAGGQVLSEKSPFEDSVYNSAITGSITSMIVAPFIMMLSLRTPPILKSKMILFPKLKDAIFGALLGTSFFLYRSTNKSFQMHPTPPESDASN